jgi:hypothetical protein
MASSQEHAIFWIRYLANPSSSEPSRSLVMARRNSRIGPSNVFLQRFCASNFE